MNKNVIKAMAVAAIFAVSFMGISVSREKVQVAGETTDVTLVSLGTQAKAYCNEATFGSEVNNGRCTGMHNDAASRCDVSSQTSNCVRDR